VQKAGEEERGLLCPKKVLHELQFLCSRYKSSSGERRGSNWRLYDLFFPLDDESLGENLASSYLSREGVILEEPDGGIGGEAALPDLR